MLELDYFDHPVKLRLILRTRFINYLHQEELSDTPVLYDSLFTLLGAIFFSSWLESDIIPSMMLSTY